MTSPFTEAKCALPGCEEGHVVLLPPDTAADYYEYEEADYARLRDLLAVSKIAVES